MATSSENVARTARRSFKCLIEKMFNDRRQQVIHQIVIPVTCCVSKALTAAHSCAHVQSCSTIEYATSCSPIFMKSMQRSLPLQNLHAILSQIMSGGLSCELPSCGLQAYKHKYRQFCSILVNFGQVWSSLVNFGQFWSMSSSYRHCTCKHSDILRLVAE